MKRAVTKIWEEGEGGKGLACLLSLLSHPYRWAAGFRNFLYNRGIIKVHRLGCPVISVGNITVGGTGKTPLVIHLAGYFRQLGFSPAVLTRGYGGRRRDLVTVVSNGQEIFSSVSEVGEEAILLSKSLPGVPVLVGPNRVKSGRLAREKFPVNLIILDDAFQHRAVYRDLDILLLNRLRPLGNGRLLPRGPLREGRAGLQRADVIVYTGGANQPAEKLAFDESLLGLPPQTPRFFGRHRPTELIHPASGQSLPPEILRGKSVCLFSGIGSPAEFQNTLESLGARVAAYQIYPDHHQYRPGDIENLKVIFRNSQADFLVTTEKDGVKIIDFADSLDRCHVLRISFEIVAKQLCAWHRTLAAFLPGVSGRSCSSAVIHGSAPTG